MNDQPTPTDHMNYNEIVERALKGVVRESLERVAGTGLPGDHHFYISFLTEYPDVVLPDHLRSRYPDEITIVLQHEFWDIETNDEGFSVTLSFNNKREFISVPWFSITGFADPSVQFGLQFKTLEDRPGHSDHNALANDMAENMMADVEDEAPLEGDEDRAPVSADVVELDQFRKK